MLITAFQKKEGVTKNQAVYFIQIFLNRLIFIFFVSNKGYISDNMLFTSRILKSLAPECRYCSNIFSSCRIGHIIWCSVWSKKQVDSNSKQISLNRDTIRRKIINPISGSSPKEILQTRLAKGEITLEEYDLLKSKLI